MPELPEVETTRRGLMPYVEKQRVRTVILRRPDLRWPISAEISVLLPGLTIDAIRRRAKYLLFDTSAGSALLHLGMSGSLRVVSSRAPVSAHDHVDIVLQSNRIVRFNDPRRFGCMLWQPINTTHTLLRDLGPEPLSDGSNSLEFDGDYLYARSRGRKAPVKVFLMDQRIVVGVGNIYAAEALFEAGISPLRAAGRISRERYRRLADAIKRILQFAITRGGTTLRDYLSPDGMPGYFEQELLVYGREQQPCRQCGATLRHVWIGQRATVWCAHCQR